MRNIVDTLQSVADYLTVDDPDTVEILTASDIREQINQILRMKVTVTTRDGAVEEVYSNFGPVPVTIIDYDIESSSEEKLSPVIPYDAPDLPEIVKAIVTETQAVPTDHEFVVPTFDAISVLLAIQKICERELVSDEEIVEATREFYEHNKDREWKGTTDFYSVVESFTMDRFGL